MTKTNKATLFSLVGFPGAGHLYLKHYKSGIAYSLIVVAVLVVLVSYAVKRANTIAESILSGTVPLDVGTIMGLIRQAPVPEDAFTINLATYVLIIVWIIAALDTYRIGRNTHSG